MGEVNIEVYIHFLINMALNFVKLALILLNRMALRKGSTDISSKQVLLYLLKLVSLYLLWQKPFLQLFISSVGCWALFFSTDLLLKQSNAKPDYTFLRIFGCFCYLYLRPYNSHKIQFRFSPCVFLGYSLRHKGYKCPHSSGKIYISRHVVSLMNFNFPSKITFTHLLLYLVLPWNLAYQVSSVFVSLPTMAPTLLTLVVTLHWSIKLFFMQYSFITISDSVISYFLFFPTIPVTSTSAVHNPTVN